MGTAVQMAATSTGGSESGLASIDVPMNGNIIAVEWSVTADYDTDNDFQRWQLSFGSALTSANDSRQVISNCTVGGLTFTAGGSVVAGRQAYTKLPDIPVGMGERLYLHSLAAAGVVGTAIVLLHFDFDLDKVAVRRR